jgi:acetyl-CoA C-acetyltransferase
MGNVVSAGIGQAPSRQAALGAGIPITVPTTDINKVCASGTKAIMLAAQNIMLGQQEVMIAGGMESMSNIPHYIRNQRFKGFGYGHGKIDDGLQHDGLWDAYNNFAMGVCGEDCAKKFSLTREEQDRFTVQSYTRAKAAWDAGRFKDEVVPVEVMKGKEKVTISVDEEFSKVKFDKISSLKPVFDKNGTITAANASKINDGASALVLMSGAKAKALGLTPIARIRGFGDAARTPIEFTIAPSDAVPIALKHAKVSASDIEYHEINEAFAVVALANSKIMNLDESRVNVNGGAIALGHPLGSSGSRIVVTLLHVLKQKDATLGCASICNGGGGASALIVERL